MAVARRILLLLLAAAGIAGLIRLLPAGGLDLVWIKRLNLLLALGAAAVLLYGAAEIRRGGTGRRAGGATLALALLAVLGYLNFFSFHGERTWIHLHDVAHYYLGSKYYEELGYRDLYTAMLRAEAETHSNRFRAVEVRDLETYEQVHIRRLLARSGPVRAAFSDGRWEAFRTDVEFFRSRLGPQYGTLLLDHGFNPTPVWALLGGALSNLVPAGSHAGILALTLIDPVLILVSLAMVGWAFGRSTALVALLHFCVIYGATFGWTGGAFMRSLWLFALVASICLLRRGRHGLAGAALALSAGLRVFPLFFALPLLMKGGAWALARWRGRGTSRGIGMLPPGRYLRYAGGLMGGLVILGAATALLPQGLEPWSAFGANMGTHVETISPNMVGLTELLAFRPGGGKVTREEFKDLKARRQRIHTAQVLLVFAPALLLAAFVSSRFTDWSASVLVALPLLYVGLSLASYYYVFLILLVPVFRGKPRALAALFAVEAVPYAAMLLTGNDALLYIIRGAVLVPLFAFFLAPPALRQWRGLMASQEPGPAKG